MNWPTTWWWLIAVSAVGFAGCAALLRGARGTVMTAPLIWGVVVWTGLVAVTLFSMPLGVDDVDPVYGYLAATATLLPGMAVFGAKRPQHVGWQWIVLALWATLVWPALEAKLLYRPLTIAAQPLRAWFLVILLFAQWTNWCVTRYLPAITLATAAQAMLLWPNFPWTDGVAPAWAWPAGFSLAALVPWEIVRVKRREFTTPDSGDAWREYDRLWRDFRDAFGVVWALRAMERVNEVARLQKWNVELTWSGFAAPRGGDHAHEGSNFDRARVDQVWNNVLRRFVDDAWIRKRLGRDLHENEEAQGAD